MKDSKKKNVMRKLRLTICGVMLFGFGMAQTQVFIVDNNFNAPTGTNVFTTLQEAADAAEANPGMDIIQVKPSSSNYGDVLITTEVILEGIGFNLTKDFPMNSEVNDITLTDRGDGSDNASNSIIRGLIIEDIFLGVKTSGSNYTLSNVIIENCRIDSRIGNFTGDANVDNLVVKFN